MLGLHLVWLHLVWLHLVWLHFVGCTSYGCTSHGCTLYGCACQEEHFDLIFSLNDTTGAGHIKVAELAQFMESLGHGLPAHQLEEMIKDMGMDEDIDRTIFLDGFLLGG